MTSEPTNPQIAEVLERIADRLDSQDANPFRVRAYREGAQTVRDVEQSIAQLVRQNQFDDLKALPHIGDGLAAVIGEYVTSGKSSLLAELEAEAAPGEVFSRVPGIGPELAERIAEQLDIDTLADLEVAAHDGRLATVAGFGPRRVEAVQAALAGMLSQSNRRQPEPTQSANERKSQAARPSVELLLALDEDYRRRAEAGELRKIAPRRFNPNNEAWLPILNTQRYGWTFTALYSNTAKAHELDKTHDWVVIYFERDGKERQHTVVTETQGPLTGKRVVRGRALENQEYYSSRTASLAK